MKKDRKLVAAGKLPAPRKALPDASDVRRALAQVDSARVYFATPEAAQRWAARVRNHIGDAEIRFFETEGHHTARAQIVKRFGKVGPAHRYVAIATKAAHARFLKPKVMLSPIMAGTHRIH